MARTVRAPRRRWRRRSRWRLARRGGGEADGDEEAAGGRIDFLVTADAEEAAVYEELVRAYRAKTGATVRLTPIPDTDGFLQRLSTSYSAGRPPAVWLINHRRLGPYLRPGAIDPAGPRLGTEGRRSATTCSRRRSRRSRSDGELQCVPQNASNLVVYVNRDRFRGGRRADAGGPAGPTTSCSRRRGG